jgi:hypothetical protein
MGGCGIGASERVGVASLRNRQGAGARGMSSRPQPSQFWMMSRASAGSRKEIPALEVE